LAVARSILPSARTCGVVADAAQQAVGDAWRAAGAHGDLGGAVAVDGHAEDVGRALDDEAELVVGVELQAQQDAEARAQRRREQAGARGGGDEGEGLDVQLEGARGGPGPIMMSSGSPRARCRASLAGRAGGGGSRRGTGPACRDVGEDGGQVALDLQGGAAGLLEADVELVGDDGGERGLAQAGRPEEQDVVERLAADFGGFERDRSCCLALVWPMNSERRWGAA
jgi:hypothetical protein